MCIVSTTFLVCLFLSSCSLSSYKCESISPLDDLAFDMYQDPEVAHIIRLLDQKKQVMVREERFDSAKELKQAIADLQKVIAFALFCLKDLCMDVYFKNSLLHTGHVELRGIFK